MICENCNREHDGSYGSGRFCSKQCARSFSTKYDNKNETKLASCIKCGKEVKVNKRINSNVVYCENCTKYVKVCLACGKIIKTSNKRKKFCSNQCSGFYRRANRGNPFSNKKYFEKYGFVPKNKLFDITYEESHGRKYQSVYVINHPLGYEKMLEHRAIMELHIGRTLDTEEFVHHKDENGKNNKISNLMIMSRSEHASYHKKLKNGV